MAERWTPAMKDYVSKNKHLPRLELLEYISKHYRVITMSSLHCFMHNNGLTTKRRIGTAKPRRIPGEQHKKPGCEGPNLTSFKKGQLPANRQPIGTESLMARGYIRVKIAENKWVQKHIKVWVDSYGPVPKNHVIYAIDGDPANTELENLICLSRRTLQSLNRWSGIKEAESFELRQSIVLTFMVKSNIALIEEQRVS